MLVGYYHYRLRNKQSGIYTLIKAHRLVAKHFLKDYSEELTVNHKNFDKSDNRVSNLEMMTRKENMIDYHNNFKSYKRYICNETNEVFHSFKSFCKRHNINWNKYYFRKCLMDKTYYKGTAYTFTEIIEGKSK